MAQQCAVSYALQRVCAQKSASFLCDPKGSCPGAVGDMHLIGHIFVGGYADNKFLCHACSVNRMELTINHRCAYVCVCVCGGGELLQLNAGKETKFTFYLTKNHSFTSGFLYTVLIVYNVTGSATFYILFMTLDAYI